MFSCINDGCGCGSTLGTAEEDKTTRIYVGDFALSGNDCPTKRSTSEMQTACMEKE